MASFESFALFAPFAVQIIELPTAVKFNVEKPQTVGNARRAFQRDTVCHRFRHSDCRPVSSSCPSPVRNRSRACDY